MKFENDSFDASMVMENTLTSTLCSKNCLTNSCIARMDTKTEKKNQENKSTQFSKCHFVGFSMS